LSNKSSFAAGFGSTNNSLIISRRSSAKRIKHIKFKKSTLSEDPYRNKKIHGRFTSGNRNVEGSDSDYRESDSDEMSSSDEQDDIFENIHNIGFNEIRETGFKVPQDLIVFSTEYLKSKEEEEKKFFELPGYSDNSVE
jgi:hypothetical protein